MSNLQRGGWHALRLCEGRGCGATEASIARCAIPPSLVSSRRRRTVSWFTGSVLRGLDSYRSQPGMPTCARPLPVLGQCRQSSTYRVGMEVLGQERGPSRGLPRCNRKCGPVARIAAKAVRLRSKTRMVWHPALVARGGWGLIRRTIESRTSRHLLRTRASGATAIPPVRRIPDRFASRRSRWNRWRSRESWRQIHYRIKTSSG